MNPHVLYHVFECLWIQFMGIALSYFIGRYVEGWKSYVLAVILIIGGIVVMTGTECNQKPLTAEKP